MSKKVLSVGQCTPDHNSIRNFLESNFDCEVTRIDSTEEAINQLHSNRYDLVLVNRKLDIDYSDGNELIKRMAENEDLKAIPVMLISNFPEYQKKALGLGAVPGFGKMEFGKPETKKALSRFLDRTNRQPA